MADPKGPETGQGAKGGQSARPRPQTLDLSATDVSKKPEASRPEASKPEAAKAAPAEPAKSDALKSDPATAQPKPADAPKPAEAAKPVDASKLGEAPKSVASPKPAEAVKPTAANGPTAGEKPDVAAAQSKAGSEPAKPFEPAKSSEPTKPSEPAKTSAESKPADRPQAPAGAARPGTAVPPSSSMSTGARADTPREGVGVMGIAAAAVGGAAIAVLVIALFGKSLMGLGGSGDAARMSAAEAKLDAVGRDVAALRAELSKTAQSTDTSAIDARLADVSKAIEASNGRVGGVEGELKTLSAKVSEPTPPDPAITALAGRVEGLELRFQQSPTADALAGLAGRIEGVEARLGDLPTKQVVQEVSRSVAAMGDKIEQATGPLTRRVDEVAIALKDRPKGDPAARLVVALDALDGALASGRPFAPELAAATAAAGQSAELAGLAPHAPKGLPTREALGAELAATIGGLEPVKTSAGGSMFERLVANAGGVVKITPKDAASGSDPAAIRAQVAAAGAAGDIEGALASRGKLDEAARAATDQWAEIATALVSAETALRSARTAALARLTAND